MGAFERFHEGNTMTEYNKERTRNSEDYKKLKLLVEEGKVTRIQETGQYCRARIYLNNNKHFIVGTGAVKLLQSEEILTLKYTK